ncbi:hypothetical protein GDO86_020020 [Hymenochirus boettgeri]|uniref:Uncharacterized protein n=1 Tax=Hymenochirus boettgeri TaxID=247094 RepID=A0A8T2IFK3_9PIPI|nr:hypothetical protein GDO86_020020 [Hymenochirus boettgeri]
MVLAGGQWTGSAENLEGPADNATGKRRKDLGSMAFSTTAIDFSAVSASSGYRSKVLPKSKDGASYEDLNAPSVGDENGSVSAPRGTVTVQNRSQSHIGGDFSLYQNNEQLFGNISPAPYLGQRLKKSAASSPMLRLKLNDGPEAIGKKPLGSPGSEVVSLKQFLEESSKLTISQIRSGSQENLLDEVMRSLSSSVESAGFQSPTLLSPGISLVDRKSAKPEQCVRPNLRKTEESRFTFPVLTTTQSSGENSPLAETTVHSERPGKDTNPYATLPRASSVISTAEGTTRRTSIHDFLSKDNRSPVSVDPSPTTEDAPCLSSEYCSVQHPLYVQTAKSFVEDSVLHESNDNSGLQGCQKCKFTQVCKDSIPYSTTAALAPCRTLESAKRVTYPTPCLSYPYLSLNKDLVSSISGLPCDGHCAFSSSTNLSSEPLMLQAQSSSKDDCVCPAVDCTSCTETEKSLSVSEDNQGIWYEYGCV